MLFDPFNAIFPSAFASVKVISIAIGILILPLFDTLRVFILRLMNGKSPFHPDRRHIHHALIDAGLSHMQATGLLIAISIVFIILSFMLQKIGNFNLLVIIILLATVLSIIAGKFAKRKLSKV